MNPKFNNFQIENRYGLQCQTDLVMATDSTGYSGDLGLYVIFCKS